MKLSISLHEDDVAFVDGLAPEFGSRSAVLAHAIRLPRTANLGDQYEQAWDEWEESGEAEAWEAVAGDGIV